MLLPSINPAPLLKAYRAYTFLGEKRDYNAPFTTGDLQWMSGNMALDVATFIPFGKFLSTMPKLGKVAPKAPIEIIERAGWTYTGSKEGAKVVKTVYGTPITSLVGKSIKNDARFTGEEVLKLTKSQVKTLTKADKEIIGPYIIKGSEKMAWWTAGAKALWAEAPKLIKWGAIGGISAWGASQVLGSIKIPAPQYQTINYPPGYQGSGPTTTTTQTAPGASTLDKVIEFVPLVLVAFIGLELIKGMKH